VKRLRPIRLTGAKHEDCAEHWRHYKRVRNWWWFIWLGYVPIVFAFTVLIRKLFGIFLPSFALAGTWIALFLVCGIRLSTCLRPPGGLNNDGGNRRSRPSVKRYSGRVAVDDPGVVDVISESQIDCIVLTISDHLDWQESTSHQLVLQSKLNRYLAFVESGEILEHRPDATTKRVVFRVVCKYEPDASGRAFLERARSVIEGAGFEFQYQFFGHSA
jgi:hypothetical protein